MAIELRDKFGRKHDYLRISLVDKCNLRCQYCMPEDVTFLPSDQLMSRAEILEIATKFVADFGITKIRLTGGEPLVRKDAADIIRDLAQLPVKLSITTNGILLDQYLDVLKEAQIQSLNISLDSFDPEKFHQITRRNVFDKVLSNIDLALQNDFRVKLNMVVMKGINDNELVEFVRRTENPRIHARFIEFMPFKGNSWVGDLVFSYEEILEKIAGKYPIQKLDDKPNSTSKAFQVEGFGGTFAIISTVTHPFCSTCNRIRLTAEGKLRNCLFARDEFDLLSALRKGEDISHLIQDAILAKFERLGGLPPFTDRENLIKSLSDRSMVKIGG